MSGRTGHCRGPPMVAGGAAAATGAGTTGTGAATAVGVGAGAGALVSSVIGIMGAGGTSVAVWTGASLTFTVLTAIGLIGSLEPAAIGRFLSIAPPWTAGLACGGTVIEDAEDSA